jgi:hypothetical protein
MPNPEILEGNKGMDTVLYQGTGAELAITDLEFSPDFVWIKNRDDTHQHIIADTVRGATKFLSSNLTNPDGTNAQTVKSFDSNGFTLGTEPSNNNSGDAFVSWNWKEDPKYGFDIVSYTGLGTAHTVPHNLGVVPEMLVHKNRSNAENWNIYHRALGATHSLWWSLDWAAVANIVYWNNTEPTSSVFTVGSGINAEDDEYIVYLFASIPGYSKVFSYTGNGSADGPFVYCGFRPRYILGKNSSVVQNWFLYDTARSGYNLSDNLLYVDLANVETTPGTHGLDILSNGFKTRGVSQMLNGSGNTITGMAFAEHPFKFANAR